MTSIDALFNSLFVVDNVSSEANTVADKDWPVFPDEKPGKVELKKWIDKWNDGLNAGGYAALLRGDEPFDVKELKERDLLD